MKQTLQEIYAEIDLKRRMQREADLVYQETPEDQVWPKLNRSIVRSNERFVDHLRRQDAKNGVPLRLAATLADQLRGLRDATVNANEFVADANGSTREPGEDDQ